MREQNSPTKRRVKATFSKMESQNYNLPVASGRRASTRCFYEKRLIRFFSSLVCLVVAVYSYWRTADVVIFLLLVACAIYPMKILQVLDHYQQGVFTRTKRHELTEKKEEQ